MNLSLMPAEVLKPSVLYATLVTHCCFWRKGQWGASAINTRSEILAFKHRVIVIHITSGERTCITYANKYRHIWCTKGHINKTQLWQRVNEITGKEMQAKRSHILYTKNRITKITNTIPDHEMTLIAGCNYQDINLIDN